MPCSVFARPLGVCSAEATCCVAGLVSVVLGAAQAMQPFQMHSGISNLSQASTL